jgi:DNA-binding transcriptional regulator LsrR (DeoR family)
MTMAEITEAEAVAELYRLSLEHGSTGLTTREWASKLAVSEKVAQRMLAAAKALGRLVVGRGFREGLDGRRSRVPVYSVKEQ